MYPKWLEVYGTNAAEQKIVTTDLVEIKDPGMIQITVGVIYAKEDGSILKGEYTYLTCEKEFPGMTLQEWPLPPAPIVPPTAPSDLEARHLENSVELLWVDRDSQKTITTFEIQSNENGGIWMQENIVAEGTISYIMKGANPLSKYQFRIRGINSAGEGEWSEVVDSAPFVYPLPPVVTPGPVTGTPIKSGTDISKLHPLAKGEAYIAEDGDYRGNSVESGIVIQAKNLGKATWSGSGSLAAKGATDVSITGFTFHFTGADTQDNASAAILPGARWKLTDCVQEGALGVGIGVMKVAGCRLTRVISRNNGRAGIGGTSVSDTILQSCQSTRNNSKGDPNGGGGKWTRVNGLIINDHLSRDNNGPGFWLDYNNINVTLNRGSYIYNVDFYSGSKLKAGGAGIFFEISGIKDGTETGGLLLIDGIEAFGNRVGISKTEMDLSTNEDVNTRSSSNVEVRNSKIGKMIMSGGAGKRTETADRGTGLYVHDNRFLQALRGDGRFGNILSKVKVANNIVVPSL